MIVSVIIPLYNKEQFIERAIRSVLDQTIQCDEIIVVDDGSTDNSSEIILDINNPLIKLITQNNKGVSAARNRGIKEAKGDLIAFIDADDAWEPRFLEVIRSLVEKYPYAGAYGTAYKLIIPRLSLEIKPFNIFAGKNKDGLLNYIIASNKYNRSILNSSSTAVHKNILEKIGLFPEGEIIYEDIDTWLRISFKYLIAWSNEYLSNYYVYENNFSKNRICKNEPIIFNTARIAIRNGIVHKELAPYLSDFLAGRKLFIAGDYILHGDNKRIRILLEETKNVRRYSDKVKWYLLFVLNKLPYKLAKSIWKLSFKLAMSIYLLKYKYLNYYS